MLQEHQEVNVSSKLRDISLARIILQSKEFQDKETCSLQRSNNTPGQLTT